MYKPIDEMRDILVAKAGEDADFRAELLADPKAVINKEFDIDVPDNVEIKVHESDLSTYHLSLPPQKLTGEQLETIAGGYHQGWHGGDGLFLVVFLDQML